MARMEEGKPLVRDCRKKISSCLSSSSNVLESFFSSFNSIAKSIPNRIVTSIIEHSFVIIKYQH